MRIAHNHLSQGKHTHPWPDSHPHKVTCITMTHSSTKETPYNHCTEQYTYKHLQTNMVGRAAYLTLGRKQNFTT